MKVRALIIGFLFVACSQPSIPDYTVKITNLANNSGGSGSIVHTSSTSSEILTNGHVCGVVVHGGLVHTSDHVQHFVKSYRVSQLHDLCLITVQEDLHVSAGIASHAPARFSDALVSGHPRLLPVIMTYGHFSDKQIIQVNIGFRACTAVDLENPDLAIFCMFLGKLPVIKNYESIVISSTIQPGSSGSAVYDEYGHIAAVIFAGSGDIGYGFAVPYEYVAKFLTIELKSLPVQAVDDTVELSSLVKSGRSDEEYEKQVKQLCTILGIEKTNTLCQSVE